MARHLAVILFISLQTAVGAVAAQGGSIKQIEKIVDPDGGLNDRFGGVYRAGDTLFVSAPQARNEAGLMVGAVHVYQRIDDAWKAVQRLQPLDGTHLQAFGSPAVDVNLLVVGARGDDDAATDAGAVYCYVHDGEQWTQTQKIVPPDGQAFDNFGWAVAIEDGWLYVSAPFRDDRGAESGCVYLYHREGDLWEFDSKMHASDGQPGDYFAAGLRVDGATMIVSAHGNNDLGGDAGAVYFFEHDVTGWIERQKILASDGERLDEFGWGLDIEGDILVVGATGDDDRAIRAGAVYVFLRSGEVFQESFKIVPKDGSADAYFGARLSLHRSALLIGAPGDQQHGASAGALYFKGAAADPGDKMVRITPQDPQAGQQFGNACALDDETIFAGAPGDDDAGPDAGAVYIFSRPSHIADLTDFSVAFGTHVSGSLPDLRQSDDQRVVGRSGFGFLATEPNVFDLVVGAQTSAPEPQSFDLTIEGRLNHAGGTCRVRLKNWTTNRFEQVHEYSLGLTEIVEVVTDVAAADRVRAADGRVELSLRQSVLNVFSLSGFESRSDWVEISLE